MKSSCPDFTNYDKEINLAYNRFRYYCPEDGRYISQDPIRLHSGEYNFYNYVGDPNRWVDILGLDYKTVKELRDARNVHGLYDDKIEKLEKLSDDELLEAFNNPKTGEYVELNDIGGIAQGHHRINEIVRRADDQTV